MKKMEKIGIIFSGLIIIIAIFLTIQQGVPNPHNGSISIPVKTPMDNQDPVFPMNLTPTIIQNPITISHPIVTTMEGSAPENDGPKKPFNIWVWDCEGLASNPSVGLDRISVVISLADYRSPGIDLTKMTIFYYTPNTKPIILNHGSFGGSKPEFSSKSVFMGKGPVDSLIDIGRVELIFAVNKIPANTKIHIELRHPDYAPLSFTLKTPAMISERNRLYLMDI